MAAHAEFGSQSGFRITRTPAPPRAGDRRLVDKREGRKTQRKLYLDVADASKVLSKGREIHASRSTISPCP